MWPPLGPVTLNARRGDQRIEGGAEEVPGAEDVRGAGGERYALEERVDGAAVAACDANTEILLELGKWEALVHGTKREGSSK